LDVIALKAEADFMHKILMFWGTLESQTILLLPKFYFPRNFRSVPFMHYNMGNEFFSILAGFRRP